MENRKTVVNNTDEKILYYSAHDNVNAFFFETGIFYNITSIDPAALRKGKKEKERKEVMKGIEEEEKKGVPISLATVKMSWIGSNPHPQVVTGEKAPGYHTYIKNNGRDYTGLSRYGYKTIKYINLYPGIDAEYSFPAKGGMKYNLICTSGRRSE